MFVGLAVVEFAQRHYDSGGFSAAEKLTGQLALHAFPCALLHFGGSGCWFV
jgi:hypothetical protein